MPIDLSDIDPICETRQGPDTGAASELVQKSTPPTNLKTTKNIADTPPNIPSELEKLQITHLLGSGGFGSVYLGHLDKIPIAVKKLHSQAKNFRAQIQSFKAELSALNLKHPNIVRTFASSSEDFSDEVFLVMEYAGDRNLEQLINDSSQDLDHTRRTIFALDIAYALQYVHANHVVHLDVKPSNIILSPNGTCKLGDFGCSQVVEEETGRVSPTHRSYLTGTFAYRAPELLRGEPPGTKADVFAFGVTLWQMLSRQQPYGGENQHVVIFGVVAYNLRPDQSITSVLEDPCDIIYKDLYRECWNAQPMVRPTAEELVYVLETWRSYL